MYGKCYVKSPEIKITIEFYKYFNFGNFLPNSFYMYIHMMKYYEVEMFMSDKYTTHLIWSHHHQHHNIPFFNYLLLFHDPTCKKFL